MKFGDWVVRKLNGERLFVIFVSPDGDVQTVNDEGRIAYFNPIDLKSLPDCTGWGWKPPLQLREGGFYKNRRGDVVGPITTNGCSSEYPWVGPNSFAYMPGGQCLVAGAYDLIEEVDKPYRTPQPGEQCEVSDYEKDWYGNYRLVGTLVDGRYVVDEGGGDISIWKFARTR